MTWAAYEPWRPAFESVMDPDLYTLEWLDRRILASSAQILTTPRAAIVFELRSYPTGAQDVHGLIAAGALQDITGILVPRAEDIGRELGCVGALIESRDGWARVLREHGYHPYQTSVRKVL